MGKKRRKNGKRLFLHGACLLAVLLLSAGCATISDFQRKYQEDKHLQPADNLAIKGDYEGALKAYEDVVKLFAVDSPGDKALFRMGLIWAHPDNPERDVEKALKYFQQLPRDFPRSPLREEARVWTSAINELIRCKGRAKDLEEAHELAIKGDYEGALKAYGDIVRLFPGDTPGDSALFRMGLIWAHPDNPERDVEKALKYFQQLPRDFPRSPLKRQASLWVSAINELIRHEDRVQELEEAVKSLNNRLNALKEIDIGIEEKKREDRPRE